MRISGPSQVGLFWGGSCIFGLGLGLGLVGVMCRIRFRVSIGGRCSLGGSFKVRVRVVGFRWAWYRT